MQVGNGRLSRRSDRRGGHRTERCEPHSVLIVPAGWVMFQETNLSAEMVTSSMALGFRMDQKYLNSRSTRPAHARGAQGALCRSNCLPDY